MNLFAETDGGVLLSPNNGTSWTAVNTGMPNTTMNVLVGDGTNRFAGTGSGVWRRQLAEMSTAVQMLSASQPPKEFILAQNYPNPFNPSTTIKFELPTSSDVRLSVYDVLGREGSVPVNERRNAGIHDFKFDGSNLTSGVYFYRLTAGSFVQTRKLMVL